MPITVKSSIFSFVDFNPAPIACNDAQMPLPAVSNFAIKFQVQIFGASAAIQPWAAPVYGTAPVLPARTRLRRLCGRLSFPITFSAFPATISQSGVGALPLFDAGFYTTPQEFVDNLNSKNEFTWNIGSDSIYTDSCCIPVFNGNITVSGTGGFSYFGQLLLDNMTFYAGIPALSFAGIVPLDECFAYGLYSTDPNTDPASGIGVSNIFKNIAANCFLTYVDYYSTNNSFGFDYSCGVQNSAWLPLYLLAPNNPTFESVYVESGGLRRVLSASMDEEYELRTDRLTQWLHRKIESVLLHDIKVFTNTFYDLPGIPFTKNAPYVKEWDKDLVKIPTATATSKLIKNLTYFNSGCCVDAGPCCDTVDPICVQLIDMAITTEIDNSGVAPGWKFIISAATFNLVPTANQVIDISFRERYSLGAFTPAGTITFNPSGAIISMPNPFEYGIILDAWEAIEILAVNQCGSNDMTFIAYNPCENMVGMLGSTYDAGGGTWGVAINSLVYSNWPPFSTWRNITSTFREYPSGVLISVGTSFDVIVDPGYVVTLAPSPVNFVMSGSWEKVEITLNYQCGKSYSQVFTNPLSGCAAISAIKLDSVTATDANFEWPRVLPTPPDGYDWELRNASNTTTLQSGNVTMPGGTLFLYVDSLTTGTDYILRVRAVCDRGGGEFSSWTNLPFTTS